MSKALTGSQGVASFSWAQTGDLALSRVGANQGQWEFLRGRHCKSHGRVECIGQGKALFCRANGLLGDPASPD